MNDEENKVQNLQNAGAGERPQAEPANNNEQPVRPRRLWLKLLGLALVALVRWITGRKQKAN